MTNPFFANLINEAKKNMSPTIIDLPKIINCINSAPNTEALLRCVEPDQAKEIKDHFLNGCLDGYELYCGQFSIFVNKEKVRYRCNNLFYNLDLQKFYDLKNGVINLVTDFSTDELRLVEIGAEGFSVSEELNKVLQMKKCQELVSKNPQIEVEDFEFDATTFSSGGREPKNFSSFECPKISRKLGACESPSDGKIDSKTYLWKARLLDLKQRVKLLAEQPWEKPHLQGDYLQQINKEIQILEEFIIFQRDSVAIENNFRKVNLLIEAGLSDYSFLDKLKAEALFLAATLTVTGVIGVVGITGGAGEIVSGVDTGGTITSIETMRSRKKYVEIAVKAAAGIILYLDQKTNFTNSAKQFFLFYHHIPA